MSGTGERFRQAGYSSPKFLIEIEGRPIISHIIDLFPGETDILFICNQDHLDDPSLSLELVLKKYCPKGRVVSIAPHKLGPVHAVCQVENLIDTARPVIVNYCDFTCYWSWFHFKKHVIKTKCAGSIPAYKGFHPHSLGKTNYAYIVESNGFAQDIQEKKSFTNNRMQEYASSGTYYFRKGELMLEAFHWMIEKDLNVGGEFYVSLSYKFLLAQKLPVKIYPLEYFMQWGTPEDVDKYIHWSNTFRHFLNQENPLPPQGTLIMPMSGAGKRFLDKGYKMPKPLIEVSDTPMVLQAASCLPKTLHQVFVLREDIHGHKKAMDQIKSIYPDAIFEILPKMTEGQACTAAIGLDALKKRAKGILEPVTIGTCDNGVLYDSKKFKNLLNSPEIDIIVWGIRAYGMAIDHPQMFSWIKEKDNHILGVSVKEAINSPETDPIVIGTFTFCRIQDFHNCFDRLITRGNKVNGEFYLDSCINDAIDMGLRCHLFEVDNFISWGTPKELHIFKYWQSCFHKWTVHPYRLEKDRWAIMV